MFFKSGKKTIDLYSQMEYFMNQQNNLVPFRTEQFVSYNDVEPVSLQNSEGCLEGGEEKVTEHRIPEIEKFSCPVCEREPLIMIEKEALLVCTSQIKSFLSQLGAIAPRSTSSYTKDLSHTKEGRSIGDLRHSEMDREALDWKHINTPISQQGWWFGRASNGKSTLGSLMKFIEKKESLSEPITLPCHVCKQLTIKLCGKCKYRPYCSRRCQVGDWKTHKSHCQKFILICPISQEPIKEPVMTSVGQIYEKEFIEEWFTRSDNDPSTNLVLTDKTLTPLKKEEISNPHKILRRRLLIEELYKRDQCSDTVNRDIDIPFLADSNIMARSDL